MSLLLYLSALLFFLLLFYFAGLDWLGSLIISLILSLSLLFIIFPGINTSILGEFLYFTTSVIVVVFAVFFALAQRRTS